jgi:Ni/Fe-hydrogenase subunit HybB-like protein
MKSEVFSESLDQAVMGPMGVPSRAFFIALLGSAMFFGLAMVLWGYQIWTGMGVAGINNPTGWGVYIADFVFWVGIAHSGTLISAFLFLFRARFRVRFSRQAEVMTVIAIMAAGLFPLAFPISESTFIVAKFSLPTSVGCICG